MKLSRRIFLKLDAGVAATRLLPGRPAHAELPAPGVVIPDKILDSHLYLALHTSRRIPLVSLGPETTYTEYKRAVVTRDRGSWEVSERGATNRREIAFPECTGGQQTLTHIAALDSKGRVLYWWYLVPAIQVSVGVTPVINARGLRLDLPAWSD